MMDIRVLTAERLKRLLIVSSSLIEEYTREVCPGCIDVCCRQKHGVYRERDILYLHALGVEVPPRDEARPLEGPCQFMGPRGCFQPRWLRPFKCTWYFCEPLLAALDQGPQRRARRLSAHLREMILLFDNLEG
jgi:hypothetical protein